METFVLNIPLKWTKNIITALSHNQGENNFAGATAGGLGHYRINRVAGVAEVPEHTLRVGKLLPLLEAEKGNAGFDSNL